jgi:hypothetical protein
MEQLQYLRDVVNGKRRRFLNVSSKAAAFFKQWLGDYHTADTLEDILNQYEMGCLLDDCLHVHARCVGKRVEVEFGRPPAPWDGNRSEPYNFNGEVEYLVLTFVTTPKCERLRLCPQCGTCYIARGGQKFCSGLCGRRAASKRIVNEHYSSKRERRIAACRAAYAKYQTLNPKPRQTVAEYVLHEANRQLPRNQKRDDKIGGPKMQVNFITRNAAAIGIPKGEK